MRNPIKWMVEEADNNMFARVCLIVFAFGMVLFPLWFLLFLVLIGKVR